MKNIYLFLISLAILISLASGGAFPLADFYLPGNDWFYFVHKSFNHYLLWKYDPFSSFLGFQYSLIVCTLISFLGLILFLLSFSPSAIIGSVVVSAGFHIGVLHLLGYDLLVTQSTYWVPWLCLVLRQVHLSDYQRHYIFAPGIVLLTGALCVSSHYLAILLVPLCYLITLSLQNWRPGLLEVKFKSPVTLLAVIATILITALTHYQLPALNFPNYPSTAHVVASGGIAGNILPLVGPTAPIPYIDRLFINDSVLAFELIFLLCGLALSLLTLKSKPYLLITLLLVLALDTLPPEPIAQVMPLASLGRVIPQLFYIPLTVVWLWVCLFYFSLVSFSSDRYGLLAIVLSTSLLIPSRISGDMSHGALLRPDHNSPLIELESRTVEDFKSLDEKFYTSRLLSPSYSILREIGLWPIDSYLAIKHGKFRSLRKYEHKFSASHNSKPEVFEFLTDRHLNTRWSPEGGKQNGDEWINLYLKDPLWLYGVELFNGFFFTDYARSLRISYLESCESELEGAPNNFEHLLTIPRWDGALAYTLDDYPYLDSPSLVKVFFPKPVFAQCLLVEQIGQSSHYDWSIARVRILRADQID